MTTPTPPRPPEGTPYSGGAQPPPGAEPGADYLWDRSGTPDPVVQELENLLAGSGLQRVEGPQAEPPRASMRELRLAGMPAVRTRWRASRVLPLAAVLLLGVGVGVWYLTPAGGWEVSSVMGAPRAGRQTLKPGGVLPIRTW